MRKTFLCRVALIVTSGLLLTGGVLSSIIASAGPAASINSGGAAPEDVFRDKGLTKVGFFLEIAHEADVHTAANSVRGLKTRLTTEAVERSSLARAVATAEDILDKLNSQLVSLDEQLKQLKNDPARYNQFVDPNNSTLKELNQRRAALDVLKQKQAKIGDSQMLYGDTLLAAAKKADEAAAAYDELAADPVLKAAIDKYNAAAPQAVKLGPSGNFSNDAAFLKKCVGDLTAEGIPVRMEGGVPVVEVIVNGKKHNMVWDSGASAVSLSSETAAELGLHATAQDRTIVSTLADGRKVEDKLIVVPEIRVGAFSAENIECLMSGSLQPKACAPSEGAPPVWNAGRADRKMTGGGFVQPSGSRFLCRAATLGVRAARIRKPLGAESSSICLGFPYTNPLSG